MPNVAKKPLSNSKVFLFSLILVVAIIGGIELSLRVWANYFFSPYLTYDGGQGRPALIPNARINTARERVEINSKGFVGPEFEKQKAPGVRRIISLGDSCTFDGGWYPKTYPGQLDTLLNERHPESRLEVINAGISGYNSEFALARLKTELLDYEPDLVIIYIGWNDLMKINPANQEGVGQHSALAKIMNQSYLVKAYSKLIFFYLRPLVMKPTVDSAPKDVSAFDSFVPASYQSNLEAALNLLKARHIKAVLFTLPTVVRPNMTYAELKNSHVAFPYYAGTYSVDKFLSLHRAYNSVIRKAADKYNVRLVDLEATFDPLPKADLFEDTMHPNAKGNSVIAHAAADALEP